MLLLVETEKYINERKIDMKTTKICRAGIAAILGLALLAVNFIAVAESTETKGTNPPIVGIDIDYWYSDSDRIYAWPNRNILVYVSTSTSCAALSVSQLKSYFNTAKTNWSSCNRNFSYTNTINNADITVEGITRTKAISMGIPPSTAGRTYISFNTSPMLMFYYGAAEKTMYKLVRAQVYLIGEYPCDTVDGARKVAVHEFGHAFGYAGHYALGNIMTEMYNNAVSIYPSSAELQHLGLAY